MLVVGLDKVEAFVSKHAECHQELSELVRELDKVDLPDPEALKARYPSAKVINGRIVVFKIRGNRYRLIAKVAYNTQILVIEAIETHAEYDTRRLG